MISVQLDNNNDQPPFSTLVDQVNNRKTVLNSESSSFTSPAKRDSIFVPIKNEVSPPVVYCPSPN